MQGRVVCLAVSPLGPGSAHAKSSPWPGATDTRKTSVSGEPDSLGARRCTARLVFFGFRNYQARQAGHCAGNQTAAEDNQAR